MSFAHPLISVIIPVYNGEKFLRETLQAILAQSYHPMDVIVIDDGSTDQSADIASSFENVIVFSQTNQGHGVARNTGIQLAKGDWLAFCDADDRWTVDKLERQAVLLQKNPHASFALGRMQILLEPGVDWPTGWNKDHYNDRPVAYIPSALLAKRSAFEVIGLFDPQYRIGTDSDWFFRARDAGLSWVIVDDVILFRRIHAQNQSRDSANSTKDLLKLVRASVHRRKELNPDPEKNLVNSVSVVIPVYNGANYLAEAIQSVLSQSVLPNEILIIDDGSTDGSAEVAKSFGNKVRYIQQVHSGAAEARNRGITAATGNLIAFLDADDVWMEGKLEQQLNEFLQDAAVDIVIGQVEQFVSSDLPEEERDRLTPSNPLLEGYSAGAMIVRRTVFKRIGSFDPQWQVGEVIDWFARVREAGLKIASVPHIVLRRRIHSENMMRRSNPVLGDYARLIKKALDRRRGEPGVQGETS
jgi:glycosyltransferase involved in cell wall biosynthesis